MKYYAVVALLLAFVAVACSQVVIRPRPLVRNPARGDRYGASLAGAQVGTYGKVKTSGRLANGLPYNLDEVYGESLGNAKVGLYGNDRTIRTNYHPYRNRPLRG